MSCVPHELRDINDSHKFPMFEHKQNKKNAYRKFI